MCRLCLADRPKMGFGVPGAPSMRNYILIIMTLVKAFCPIHRELGLGADISERMEPQVVLPETLCHSEQMADPMMTCTTLHRLPPFLPSVLSLPRSLHTAGSVCKVHFDS